MHCRVHDCVCTYVDVCVYMCVKVYICRCGWGFWASGSGLRAQEGRGTIRTSASQLPASKRVNCPCRGDSGGGNVCSPFPVWSNSHFRFHASPHFRDAPGADFRRSAISNSTLPRSADQNGGGVVHHIKHLFPSRQIHPRSAVGRRYNWNGTERENRLCLNLSS